MARTNHLIVNLTKNRISNEFVQKVTEFLHRENNMLIDIPEVENIFSSGSFSSGEFDPKFRESLDGRNVYMFGFSSVDNGSSVTPGELAFRVCATAQAAKDNGASKVIAVLPDLHFSRADKNASDVSDEKRKGLEGRGNIALVQAKMFHAAGVDTVLTMGLHSEKVLDSFEKIYGYPALEVLDSDPLIAHHIAIHSSLPNTNSGENIVFISPDAGARERIDNIRDFLRNDYKLSNISAIYLQKIRKNPNNPDQLLVNLDSVSDNFTTLENKHVLIVDDIVDTAGTLSTAVKLINNEGVEINNELQKPASVSACLIHPVLAGRNYEEAMKRLASSELRELIFFNTHPFIEDSLIYPLKKQSCIIRVAYPFGKAIQAMELGNDINSIYHEAGVLSKTMISKIYNLKTSSSFALTKSKTLQTRLEATF